MVGGCIVVHMVSFLLHGIIFSSSYGYHMYAKYLNFSVQGAPTLVSVWVLYWYVGVNWFVFHLLQLLPIIFT